MNQSIGPNVTTDRPSTSWGTLNSILLYRGRVWSFDKWPHDFLATTLSHLQSTRINSENAYLCLCLSCTTVDLPRGAEIQTFNSNFYWKQPPTFSSFARKLRFSWHTCIHAELSNTNLKKVGCICYKFALKVWISAPAEGARLYRTNIGTQGLFWPAHCRTLQMPYLNFSQFHTAGKCIVMLF